MKVKKTLTKKQRKMKFNSILLSIILGAIVLTGCQEPKIYPETLTTNEKETIKNLNGDTYSVLLANIDAILNIKNIPAEYKAQLKDVREVLDDQEFLAETYNNLFSDSLIEKQEMITYYAMSVRDQKTNDNYTNYSTYQELYNNYKSKVEEFNDKIPSYNDVKVNYNADHTNYENAYYTLKNGIKTDAYNDLINFMISIRNDFKDNYFLDKEENLASYTKGNAKALFNNAVAENDDNIIVDAELDSTKEEYNTSKQSVENAHAVKSDIDAAYFAAQDADTKESSFELRDSENGKDDPVIGDPSKVFTYADNAVVNANNYNDGDNITISIPATENEESTTVNIAKLYEQYTTIAEKVGENGSVSISYADAANTTIEGGRFDGLVMDLESNPENVSKFNSFFNAIAPENATAESLPKISARINVAGNLYGTGLDKFIEKYYDLEAGDKINGITVVDGYFDAIAHLNNKEGVVYDNNGEYITHSEDSNDGNYYNLDVNAALLMNAKLKNVNITGTLEQDAVFANELTNVRFNIDANGKEFDTGVNGIGLIEFAGDAPSITPRVNAGRLVLRNASSKVSFQGGFSIDVSGISDENAIHTNINHSAASFTEAIYPTQETANTSKFTPSSIRVDNNLVFGPDYYATNQQWVKAANEDKWNEYGEKKYPNVSALSAKANLDEKNNTLLNTILFNNQKVYG